MNKGQEWLAVSGGKWRGAVKKERESPGIGTLFLSQFLFMLYGRLHLSVIYGRLHCILFPLLILFFFLLLFFYFQFFQNLFQWFHHFGSVLLEMFEIDFFNKLW